MIYKICLICLIFCCEIVAQEKKKVELVANYYVDVTALNEFAEKYHLTFETSDLTHYKKAWKKKKESSIFKGFAPPIYLQDSPQKIVFWNIRRPYLKHFDFREFPDKTFVLFLWEPPSQITHMYREKTFKNFSKIYTWDDDLVDNKKFFKLYYPELKPMLPNLPSFESKKLCTMVVSNKKNKHPKELYSERRKVIDFFEKQHSEDFDFYGTLWKEGEFRNYKGAPPNKIETVKNYRFSFCYENMRDIKGYVSEKIFDAFAAGTVPIYWGASNIENFVPADCFIDRRNFSSLEELYSYLKNMTKEEYENYLDRIRKYLDSDMAKCFSKESFHQLVIDAVR